jgi:hypothetical protein
MPGDFEDDIYDFDEHAEAVALGRGQIVVYPEDNQLQLDIDSDEQFEIYRRRISGLEVLGWDFSVNTTPSLSGLPNRHITVTVKDKVFTEVERIAFQFMLGSDSVRESLNLLRTAAGKERPTRLFETPEDGDARIPRQ